MKLFDSLPDHLADWALRQPLFFTGSASTHGSHVNISPKGLASTHFSILSPNQIAYIDRTGSGVETIAHAYENGRLCIMFISFGDTPRILRLFCRSEVVEWDQPAFPGWVAKVAGDSERKAYDAARAVIVGHVFQVQTSCGFGVPRVKKALYAPRDASGEPSVLSPELDALLREDQRSNPSSKAEAIEAPPLSELAVFEERPTLDAFWGDKVEKNQVVDYQQLKNTTSMDGLPGLRAPRRGAGYHPLYDAVRVRMQRLAAEKVSVVAGFLAAVLLYFLIRISACVFSTC